MDQHRTGKNKLFLILLLCAFSWSVASVLAIPVSALEPTMLFQPDLASIPAGERLPDELYREGNGFVSDGTGGLVSTTDNEYNAIYFGPTVRQFHYHAVMSPVTPGTSVVGGLSFKTFSYEDGKRMDLAITTGTVDKSILIYAFGMLLADNRNDNQGGLGGLTAFNTSQPVTIDLYGDRNYYAVFINGTLVIETVLPIEGTGTFGIRSQNSLVRYSDIYIETLGDVLLDGRARYYPETFETLSVEASTDTASRGEPVTFSILFNPEGKVYDDVAWYIDDELVMNLTDLEVDLSFDEAGVHEVSCVVDRQKANILITITDDIYIVPDDAPDELPVLGWPAVTGIVFGGITILGGIVLLILRRRH